MGAGADRKPHQQASAKPRKRPETKAAGTGFGTLNFGFGTQCRNGLYHRLWFLKSAATTKVGKQPFLTHSLTHTQFYPKYAYFFQSVISDPKGLKSKLENAKNSVKP